MSPTNHHVTSASDVVAIVNLLATASIEYWISGGWGVDALVGHQSRQHRDLDLLVPFQQMLSVHELLLANGFAVETDWLPTRFEMVHADGRIVDVHPIRLEDNGGARLELLEGGWWLFDAEALSGRGSVNDKPVRCVSVAQQIHNHSGYDPTHKDRLDMDLLCGHFALELPAPYHPTELGR